MFGFGNKKTVFGWFGLEVFGFWFWFWQNLWEMHYCWWKITGKPVVLGGKPKEHVLFGWKTIGKPMVFDGSWWNMLPLNHDA